MAKVEIYTTTVCPYCVAAKNLLKGKGVDFLEKPVDGDDEARAWLVKTTGQRTVPQIFIDGKPYGGFSDLTALDEKGDLDPLLGVPPAASHS